MTLNCFVHKMVGFALLGFGVLVNSAHAGAGLCQRPFPRCASTCGQPATVSAAGIPCKVKISETSGLRPVATVDKDLICVDPGTEVLWFTTETHSSFTVTFTMHPFAHFGPNVTFIGNEQLTPSGDIAIHPHSNTAPACYEYSVTHSINGSAAVLDPKVIVNGVVVNTSQESVKK